MSNELEAKFKLFKESGGWFVYKIDDKGQKVRKMNNTPHKSRKEALQHQRALYVNVPDARASEESTPMEVTASTELVLGSIRFEADTDNPRFLRFHDAVLARAETNSNRDALDEEGIQELAATITGTAIDIEHDPKKNVGFYTAGRADSGALRVDGVLWLDRCDAFGINPAEIEDGTYKLSIEAEAQTDECSICHSTHDSIASYCQHLKNKLPGTPPASRISAW